MYCKSKDSINLEIVSSIYDIFSYLYNNLYLKKMYFLFLMVKICETIFHLLLLLMIVNVFFF